MGEKKKPTSRAAAMLSKCADCCGNWEDGRKDCEVTCCALYPWMPYREREPDLTWMDYNPKRAGLVTWEDSKRKLTEEERQEMSERAKRIFGKRKKK